MKDFYSVLGVSKTAKADEIKDAYRKLSKKYHPDRQSGKSDAEKKEAEDKMKDINEAYEILGNEEKRKAYDRGGSYSGDQNDFYHRNMSAEEAADMAKKMYEQYARAAGFRTGFSSYNSGPTHKRGGDIRMHVKLTMKDIIEGCSKKVRFRRLVRCTECNGAGGTGKTVCPYCHGTGRVSKSIKFNNSIFAQETECPHCKGKGYKFKQPCNHCHESGFEEKEEILEVRFTPQDFINNTPFECVHKGHESSDPEGPNGNFIAVPVVEYDDNKYNLDRYPTIVQRVKIHWVDALLGGRLNINLDTIGTQTVDIPSCTKPHDEIVLKGKGAKVQDNNPYDPFTRGESVSGDYVLHIEYSIPNSLTSEQREILEKFKETTKNA